jgi:hypothetical protein
MSRSGQSVARRTTVEASWLRSSGSHEPDVVPGGTSSTSVDSLITGCRPRRIAQDDAADELFGRDPLALLLGMPLDQRMRQRGGALDSDRLLASLPSSWPW